MNKVWKYILLIFLVSIFVFLFKDAPVQKNFIGGSVPSLKHLFGLDLMGRDVALGLLGYTWYMILSSFLVVLLAFTWSALFGYIGSLGNDFVRKTVSIFFNIYGGLPKLILLITLFVLLDPNYIGYLILLSLFVWLYKGRLIRDQILRIKQESFVEAGKAIGVEGWRKYYRYYFLNLWPVLKVPIIFSFIEILFLDAGLSIIGVQPMQDAMTVGKLYAQYTGNLHAWWLFVFPTGILLAIVVPLIFSVQDEE